MEWYVQNDGTFERVLETIEATIASWFSEFDADATARYTAAKFVVMCMRYIMGIRFPNADHAECTEHGAAFKNKLIEEYATEEEIHTCMHWEGEWHALALVHIEWACPNEDNVGASEASPACAAFRELLDVISKVDREDYRHVTDEKIEKYGTVQVYLTATEAEFDNEYREWSFDSVVETQDEDDVTPVPDTSAGDV
tara:strand:- start:71 stop:661 length:591 start_codon:yes stop_codon:yes gene_type:complete